MSRSALEAMAATRSGVHPMRAPAAAAAPASMISESTHRGAWYMKKALGMPLFGKSRYSMCIFFRFGSSGGYALPPPNRDLKVGVYHHVAS